MNISELMYNAFANASERADHLGTGTCYAMRYNNLAKNDNSCAAQVNFIHGGYAFLPAPRNFTGLETQRYYRVMYLGLKVVAVWRVKQFKPKHDDTYNPTTATTRP
jgi:hypothetical protein